MNNTRPRLSHSPSFTAVVWNGTVFKFSPKQRLVVAALWNAMAKGWHYCNQRELLDAADSDGFYLRDLFRVAGGMHAAWNTLIVHGPDSDGPLGTYRLAPAIAEEVDSTPPVGPSFDFGQAVNWFPRVVLPMEGASW